MRDCPIVIEIDAAAAPRLGEATVLSRCCARPVVGFAGPASSIDGLVIEFRCGCGKVSHLERIDPRLAFWPRPVFDRFFGTTGDFGTTGGNRHDRN